jgi:hypothetical protein
MQHKADYDPVRLISGLKVELKEKFTEMNILKHYHAATRRFEQNDAKANGLSYQERHIRVINEYGVSFDYAWRLLVDCSGMDGMLQAKVMVIEKWLKSFILWQIQENAPELYTILARHQVTSFTEKQNLERDAAKFADEILAEIWKREDLSYLHNLPLLADECKIWILSTRSGLSQHHARRLILDHGRGVGQAISELQTEVRRQIERSGHNDPALIVQSMNDCEDWRYLDEFLDLLYIERLSIETGISGLDAAKAYSRAGGFLPKACREVEYLIRVQLSHWSGLPIYNDELEVLMQHSRNNINKAWAVYCEALSRKLRGWSPSAVESVLRRIGDMGRPGKHSNVTIKVVGEFYNAWRAEKCPLVEDWLDGLEIRLA